VFFPWITHGWRLMKKLRGRGVHVEWMLNPPFCMCVDAILWYDNLCNWVQELKGSIRWWIGLSLMILSISVIQWFFQVWQKKLEKCGKICFCSVNSNNFSNVNLRKFSQFCDTTNLESNNIFSVVVITFICMQKLWISIDACIQIINSKCK
jgi:hypothetical protein